MKKIIIIAAVIISLLFICSIFLPRKLFLKEDVIFNIERGEGSKEISSNLEKNGFIWWGPSFRLYSLISGKAGNLQAGAYLISPSMNIPQLIDKFSKGDTVKVKVTIPEGFTAGQIYEELKNFTKVDKEALKSFEGYLFPDTYFFSHEASSEEVIKTMTDNFNDKITPDLTAAIKEQGKSLEDIVVMASIIEKETRTKEEKEIVSGIFWKRMKAGYPLQSCATIAYIKGVSQWRYSYEDTRIESPYNTYLNYGLPPGPISNPGLDSIKAAVYPQKSNYWYFLSTSKGETIFSRTLTEHNLAIYGNLK